MNFKFLFRAIALTLMWAASADAAPSDIQGRAIRSDQWVIRRKEKEEEFIGNVSFQSEQAQVSSDWALIRDEQIFSARGHLHIEKKIAENERLELWGDEGVYSETEGKARAEGNLRFLHSAAGAFRSGAADKALWDGGLQQLTLTGRVRLTGPDYSAWSRQAVYDRPTGEIALEGGRPVVRAQDRDWTSEIQAEYILLDLRRQRIAARGQVHGWINFENNTPGH
ncbi:MAG: hypothetical protein A3G41_03440 [Elusimicrobia bacterium RIFCSPLOWO2_12_FULL_59_9]|nr:MAG: hypothetical protein A3G41_03440 [Elusimicrobia bacterium RIFCSPLOWO2_12_FULL_59_9]